MALKFTAADLDHAVALYQAGESVPNISRITGISVTHIYRTLEDHGVAGRGRATPTPSDLLDRYHAGASVKALAQHYGFERSVVNRMLKQAGITPRSRSEAMALRWGQSTPDQRAAMMAAAHEAARGRAQTEAHRILVAAAKDARPLSPNETYLATLLSDLGVSTNLGVPCGPYNLDLLVGHTVAVEVFGGNWHTGGRHRARFPKRARYVLDAGYALMVLWVNEDRYPLGLACAHHIVTLAELIRYDPAFRRQYWVIRGDGKILAARKDDGDEVPFVMPTGRCDYARS